MQITGLLPLMQQGLLATLPKVVEASRASMPDREVMPAGQALSVASSLPQTSVQMLVALAAAEPTIERRRKQAAQVDRGIGTLERLHQELMSGVPSVDRLQALADWSASLAVPDEPKLAALAREIDLRVRVELAKLDIQA